MYRGSERSETRTIPDSPALVEVSPPPATHASQARHRLRGRRPRVTRIPSRVQAAVQSNTTRVCSKLCGRPLSRTVPASIACGSLGILWKRLAVGRAAAAARSTDSGVRLRSQGATSCAEHGQDDRRGRRCRLRRPGGDRRAAREARAAQTATSCWIPDGFLGARPSEPAALSAEARGRQTTR